MCVIVSLPVYTLWHSPLYVRYCCLATVWGFGQSVGEEGGVTAPVPYNKRPTYLGWMWILTTESQLKKILVWWKKSKLPDRA